MQPDGPPAPPAQLVGEWGAARVRILVLWRVGGWEGGAGGGWPLSSPPAWAHHGLPAQVQRHTRRDYSPHKMTAPRRTPSDHQQPQAPGAATRAL
jgi:hypothetical protein